MGSESSESESIKQETGNCVKTSLEVTTKVPKSAAQRQKEYRQRLKERNKVAGMETIVKQKKSRAQYQKEYRQRLKEYRKLLQTSTETISQEISEKETKAQRQKEYRQRQKEYCERKQASTEITHEKINRPSNAEYQKEYRQWLQNKTIRTMPTDNQEGFATKAIHAGQDPDQWAHGSVVPPLIMSTNFKLNAPGEHKGYYYGRSGNPSRNCLEVCLAALENGKHGFVFSSGLGTTTVLMSLLESGDHIVCSDDVYGGTNRFFQECLSKQKIDVSFVDACQTENFVKSIRPNTKMLWIESPTNPLLKLADIKAICDKVKDTRPDIYIVVDNTFVTCYFQKPLELGADIVMYSLTKYMNGHSDIIMGAAITRRDDIAEKLRFSQKAMGIVPSPFDCMMVNRSLKTLELRMQQHMKNGLAVARFLEIHPVVTKVFHPYLPSHPQHGLATRQMSGHSGMIAFYHTGDSDKFLKALKIFTLAESLGGYESLAELPSEMSHASVPKAEREKLGITDQLIRLSVGLETDQDLIDDLDNALTASTL